MSYFSVLHFSVWLISAAETIDGGNYYQSHLSYCSFKNKGAYGHEIVPPGMPVDIGFALAFRYCLNHSP
jgi:hypothetical protein